MIKKDFMKTLQIIFTHDKGQDVANVPYDLINMSGKDWCLHDLNILFNGKFSFLAKEWKHELYRNSSNGNVHIPEDLQPVPELVKISMCIIAGKGEKIKSPKWYNECNGKIYLDHETTI